MNDVQSLSHSKWSCKYHIVFSPKYHRQVVYGKIKTGRGKMLQELDEQKGVEIINGEPGSYPYFSSNPTTFERVAIN